MIAFSKGKWYVDSAGVVRCDDEYDRSIAYLITSEATKELDDANASLIVAAPDMYELLKNFCDEVEACVSIYDNFPEEFIKIAERAQEIFERIDEESEDD